MRRLLQWLAFTIFFGLIPYAAVVIASSIDGATDFSFPSSLEFPPSGELIFLSVMSFASALAEVLQAVEKRRDASGLRNLFLIGLIFSIIVSALFFGLYVHHGNTSPARSAGVDCAALVEHSKLQPGQLSERTSLAAEDSIRRSLYGRWGGACEQWYREQRGLFGWSWVLAGVATLVGGVAVLAYGPTERRARRFGR